MSYIDCSSATAATNAQMVEHPRKAVEGVDIARDGQSSYPVLSSISSSSSASRLSLVAIFSGPPHLKTLNFATPVLYENYYVRQSCHERKDALR